MKPIVVIPTYNEKENVRAMAAAALENLPPDGEVLFVDDNSPDGTGGLIDEIGLENPRIHCLHRTKKEGLGRAYDAGFGEAMQLASGLKAYTKPELNTIVIPLAHNQGLAAGCQHVAVSYDIPTGLLSALKRDFAKFGRPVIPEPSRPVLLKTPHGSYYLVAKEPFSDSFIKDVTLD